uniref:Uncharacterized protein n=1 Tax=Aegilops tauschii TaxID=37682 RepID=M8BW10_AEGTA
MAAPTQTSPLRRWKRFFRAFDCVDTAIKPSDPDHSRDELRRARVDVVEQLCNAADDDDQAERLCGILDDHMAESLETLRLPPGAPPLLGFPDPPRAPWLCAGTSRRASASWPEASDALHKLDNINVPQNKEVTVDQQQHVSANSDIVMKTVGISKKAFDSAAGDRAGLCSEEKMAAAKRKFHQAYQEAEDAKRQRRTRFVQVPKMMQPIRRCTSSMVKNTFSITSQLHMA